jgi:hypothetical protein
MFISYFLLVENLPAAKRATSKVVTIEDSNRFAHGSEWSFNNLGASSDSDRASTEAIARTFKVSRRLGPGGYG